MTSLKEKCIFPECRRDSTSATRGLCRPHYNRARAMIRKGEADDADLVSRGLMLPSRRPRDAAAARDTEILRLGSTVKGSLCRLT